MAVLLYSAYQTLHYSRINKIDIYDYYYNILWLETEYSIYLTSVILKFFGYDNNTYENFFKNKGEKKFCPIPIWEYVILRAQLMLNLDIVCENVDDSWIINNSNIDQIINLTNIDNIFIQKLHTYMTQTSFDQNISYLIIEFDWNKF